MEELVVMFELMIEWMPFLLFFVPLLGVGAMMGFVAAKARWRLAAFAALACGIAGLFFLAAGAIRIENYTEQAASVISDIQQRALLVRRFHQTLAEGLAPGLLFAAVAIAPAIVTLRRTRKGRSQASE